MPPLLQDLEEQKCLHSYRSTRTVAKAAVLVATTSTSTSTRKAAVQTPVHRRNKNIRSIHGCITDLYEL